MGVSEGYGADLTVWAEDDGTLSVDVGERFVPVGEEDLERILDRLAADGGTLHVLGGTGRADDGDDPAYQEADPAMGAASWVVAIAEQRGIKVVRES